MQPMQPAAVVYLPAAARPTIYDSYLSKQSIGLGATQVAIGILCIIFNAVAIGVSDANGKNSDGVYFVGHGIWCGILFIITGGFGIGAGQRKIKCQIVTFLVLCILSAVYTTSLLSLGIAGSVSASECSSRYGYRYYDPDYYYYYYPSYTPPCQDESVIVAMEAMLAILAFIEAIVAIWGAAICCKSGICCCSSAPSMVAPAQYSLPNAQMVYISQTQGGQYVYAPQPMLQPYPQGFSAPPYYAANYPQQLQPTWAMPPPTVTASPAGNGIAPPAYPIYQTGDQTNEKA